MNARCWTRRSLSHFSARVGDAVGVFVVATVSAVSEPLWASSSEPLCYFPLVSVWVSSSDAVGHGVGTPVGELVGEGPLGWLFVL